jgi:hypothetical protein
MGAVPVAFIASPLRGEWLVFLIAAEGAVCRVFAGIVAMHRER